MELESLVITYRIKSNESQVEKLSVLMKRYCKDALSTICMEMIPNLIATDVAWVRGIVMKESKW